MSSSDSDTSGIQTERSQRVDRGAINGSVCNTNYCTEIPPSIVSNQEMHSTRNEFHSGGQPRINRIYRRETSPFSCYSVSNGGMHSCNNNFYTTSERNQFEDRLSRYLPVLSRRCPSVMSERCHSVINGRCPSEATDNSTVSTAAAIEITWALKHMKFNEDEWQLIQEEFQRQTIKKKLYKKIRKRKILKLDKQKRKNSLSEVSSKSSLCDESDDDVQSIQSTKRPVKRKRNSPEKVIPQFRSKSNHYDIAHDCTDKFKQKSFVLNNTSNNNRTITTMLNNTSSESFQSTRTSLSMRFQKSSFLQTARLDKSTNQTSHASLVQNQSLQQRFITKSEPSSIRSSIKNRPLQKIIENDKSENEEIFHATVMENTNRKRPPDSNIDSRDNKKPKTATINEQNNPGTKQTSDFKFKKPLLPRKSNNKKVVVPEVVISTSEKSQNGTNTLNTKDGRLDEQSILDNQHKIVNSTEIENKANQTKTENTTVSNKSSFSKRKLFTQKLDVAEQKNVNSDSDGNTPAKLHNNRERNKVRKLVTSQTCLSRDLTDSNATTALIHKLVTPEEITITMNKKQDNKRGTDGEKWDITSVMSVCEDSDVSATFTDEEIFNIKPSEKEAKKTENTKMRDGKNQAKSKTESNVNECKVVLAKINLPAPSTSKTNQNQSVKKSAETILRGFWDSESEWEDMPAPSNIVSPAAQAKNGTVHRRQVKNTFFNTSHVNKAPKENAIQNNCADNTPNSQQKTKQDESINDNLNKNNGEVSEQKDTLKKNNKGARVKAVTSTKPKKVQSKIPQNNTPTKLNTSRESQRLKEKKQQNQSSSINVTKTCSENDLTISTRRRTRQKENVKPVFEIFRKQANKRGANNNSESSGNSSTLNRSRFGRIRQRVNRFETSFDL